MSINPCYKCISRCAECHSTCELYKEWLTEYKEVKKQERDRKNIEYVYNRYSMDKTTKYKRYEHQHRIRKRKH